ncbi:hypothetical protein L6E12_04855 [Actinokineospora sp. PR83]|uniref:hypothetical protein n=1 Tax=Actinokineospora sp. PR83 TaxID=2884908 RepID=UPI001F335A1B|nr:hypothetical protein [Actinokineospora sp. PR83]MCG8915119.1 hypothetical protein [Actinokineospora sp. PR83]
MKRRFPRGDAGPIGAAGWLFAELAMVLVVIAIGSEVTAPSAVVLTPPVADTPTTAPSQGLALTTVRFTIPATADDATVLADFRAALDRTVGPQGRVGLILLFGKSTTANPAQGTRLSERLKAVVTPANLPQLRTTVDIRPYFGGDGAPGQVMVELFLLT